MEIKIINSTFKLIITITGRKDLKVSNIIEENNEKYNFVLTSVKGYIKNIASAQTLLNTIRDIESFNCLVVIDKDLQKIIDKFKK